MPPRSSGRARSTLELTRWTAGFEFPDFERDYVFVSLRQDGEYPIDRGRIVSSEGLNIPGASRVTCGRVRLGALSHFTPGHFREHFADTARATVAEGAAVEVAESTDPTEPRAQGVVLESVDLEWGHSLQSSKP